MIDLSTKGCDRGQNPGCGWCRSCEQRDYVEGKIDARLCEIEAALRKRGSTRPGVAERFVRMEMRRELRWN